MLNLDSSKYLFNIMYEEMRNVHKVLLGILKYNGYLEEKDLWDCFELWDKLGYSDVGIWQTLSQTWTKWTVTSRKTNDSCCQW